MPDTSTMKMHDNQQNPTASLGMLLILFFISGAAGLIYEVLWVRQFTVVLGASSHAVTLVLASFMSGMALGSWLLGRLADRLHPNHLVLGYIGIEVGVGIYALFLPTLIQGMEVVFVSLYRLTDPGFWLFNTSRLALSLALLMLPTTLIGGTLPILGRLMIHQRQEISNKVSRLYAANTFGAITGVMAAGYLLLPFMGIMATTHVAVSLNLVVAAGFWIAGPRLAGKHTTSQTGKSHAGHSGTMTAGQRVIVAGFGLSGMATMLYEVAWTRSLVMILGTTTYAFTTMLSVILLGIALGSLIYPLIPRHISRATLFAVLQLIVAFSALAAIPGFSRLPFLYLSLSEMFGNSWTVLQFLRFFLAGTIMLIPTIALGAMLPTVSALFVDRTNHLGQRLGTACAVNTTGATLGALLGGLVLVPLLGMQTTIMVAAGMNLIAAVGAIIQGHGRSILRLTASCGSIIVTGVCMASLTPWSPKIMNSGTYVYASRYVDMAKRYDAAAEKTQTIPECSRWQIWQMSMQQHELLYYRTGLSSTVAVMERADGVRFLTIDGKTDASNGYKSDMRTQVMIGQLPMLFHDDPRQTLIVGLGSGVTAGSVLSHPVRSVDCAEISPAVIEAARFFTRDNHDALNDPRLHVLQRDARNYLLTASKSYDVIISQPSNPWISGEASLFSLEWYQTVRSRLQEGGLLVQWLPTYFMDEHDLKVILNTVRQVFPNISLWTSGAVGDLIILASNGSPLRIDYDKLVRRADRRPVAADINRLEMQPKLLPFELYVMNRDELADYLYSDSKGPLPLNTDDLLQTEFATPKRIASQHTVARFMRPENLHGDPNGLYEILFNYDSTLLLGMFGTEKHSVRPVRDNRRKPHDDQKDRERPSPISS